MAEVVAILMVAVVMPVLSNYLFPHDAADEPLEPAFAIRNLLSHVPLYIGVVMMVMLVLRNDQASHQPKPTPRSEYMKEVVWGAGLGIIACGFLFGLSHVLRLLGVPATSTIWHSVLVDPKTRLVFYATSLFAAMYEEVAFRVFLQSRLQFLMNGARVLPVLMSASVFAIMHGYSVAPSIGVAAFGAFQGINYLFWKRIPRLVICHWVTSVLMVYLGLYG